MRSLFAATSIAVVFLACSSSSSSNDSGTSSSSSSSSGNAAISNPPPANPFDASVAATRVVIEIDYQAGAEPYTGSQPVFGDPWDLFKTNANELFEGSGKTLEVPTTIDAMEKLDDISGKTFDSDAILAIATKHRAVVTEGDHVAYYVVWLDGTYSENGTENPNVLGVSVGNTGVIAMFKPVIKGGGGLLSNLDPVLEQTVLVHEFGHAVGLVNNGVPLASQHHDAEHGAHCSNQDCVMYWTVEGAAAARDFVQRKVTRTDLVLFADDCLGDVRATRR